MTKKDLFRVLIKLIGLYIAIILLFMLVPQTIMELYYNWNYEINWISIIIMSVVALIAYLLLFETDVFIRLFNLEKGFDDNRIELGQLKTEGILKLGLIIVSGYLLIDNIPDFVVNLIYSFKENVNNNTFDYISINKDYYQANYYVMITAGIKLFFGFLMLTNVNSFASWLNKFNEKNEK